MVQAQLTLPQEKLRNKKLLLAALGSIRLEICKAVRLRWI